MKKYSKKISVIITAYNRKNYLYYAVKSAIDQTIDKSLYEIIIIKNFEDRKIDKLIKNSNISIKQILLKSKLIYYPNGLLISKALKKSNGEIIVFLEDDDIFEKNKLQQVLKVFENKNVICYNNKKDNIDKNGKNIKYENEKNIESFILSLHNINHKLIKKFNLNVSSISIRSNIINLSYLRQVAIGMDIFLLYLSLINGEIYIDNKKLTKYRVHNLNAGKYFEKFSSLKNLYNRYNINSWLIFKMIRNQNNKELLRYIGYQFALPDALSWDIRSKINKLKYIKHAMILWSATLKRETSFNKFILFSFVPIISMNLANRIMDLLKI